MRRALLLALLAAPLADAAAQSNFGQCQDRARDRFERDQANLAIGGQRAASGYMADIQECQRADAQQRARDTRDDQTRSDQQRLDQQRSDQQRFDQQRTDQQRADQQRLDQQRARQRDDMLRNQR